MTARSGTAPAAPAGPQPEPFAAPDAERLISDVETLRAISDPLRIRILEVMASRPTGSWSVKELAAALEVPQTRLYHHVDLLVERDLLRPAEQRVVSGIIETRYCLGALMIRLDPQLVGGGGAGESAAREMLSSIFDETRRDLERALADPGLATREAIDRPLISRGVARLTPERAHDLRSRLAALIAEFDGPSDDAAAATYQLLVTMYPDPPSKEISRG
jgi:DNA-binding transcriptional ArsR family regulator